MSDTTNTTANGTSESEQGMRVEGGFLKATDDRGYGFTVTVYPHNGNLMIGLDGKDPVVFSQSTMGVLLPYLSHYARTGRLENPPAAGALDREALGRVAAEAWYRGMGYGEKSIAMSKSQMEDQQMNEANCKVGEAVAAYVLAQTPEPVESGPQESKQSTGDLGWYVKEKYGDAFLYHNDFRIATFHGASIERHRDLADKAMNYAIMVRDFMNVKPAPIAPQPAGVVEALRELVSVASSSRPLMYCGCDAQDGVICAKCRLNGSIKQAQAALSALSSAGGEGDVHQCTHCKQKPATGLSGFCSQECCEQALLSKESVPDPKLFEHLEQFLAAGPGHQAAEKLAGIKYDRDKLLQERNHAVELLRVECEHSNSLASERDRCREMNGTLTAERDQLLAAAKDRDALEMEDRNFKERILDQREHFRKQSMERYEEINTLTAERDALRAQVVTLEAERVSLWDVNDHLRDTVRDFDKMRGERDIYKRGEESAKAEVERLEREKGTMFSELQTVKARNKRQQEMIMSITIPEQQAPTPPDPRRVVEGMRVRFNADVIQIACKGATGVVVTSEDTMFINVDGDYVRGSIPIGSYGDTIPSYLDPLPAEPVKEERTFYRTEEERSQPEPVTEFVWTEEMAEARAAAIEFVKHTEPDQTPAPPTPEPAGEIVLPEVTTKNGQTGIHWDDGSFVMPSQLYERLWISCVPFNGSYTSLTDENGHVVYRDTPEAAARDLAAIGQGPGAGVANPPACLQCWSTAIVNGEIIHEESCPTFASNRAQPAPPPFDVEKFGAGIIEGVCHYILEMFPGIREDAHGKAVQNSIDAMKAAFGGKDAK